MATSNIYSIPKKKPNACGDCVGVFRHSLLYGKIVKGSCPKRTGVPLM